MTDIKKILKKYLENEVGNLQQLKFTDFSYNIINIIRTKYGKSGQPKSNRIGTHPDYENYINDIKKGHVIALFADIANSTRMSANLPPETVLRIKKTVLSIFSQIVIALDGHVHRLQGDAILAFFNWENIKHSQSIWNSIFAAIEILNTIKFVVSPFISNQIINYKKIKDNINLANNIAVRIGLDYGPYESTIWAKLGIQDNFTNSKVYEHTATGVNVDLASKIQNRVGKNKIGIGENAYNKIHLDESFLETNIKEGQKELYIIQNPNYSYRILKNDKLLNEISNFSDIPRKFTS